MRVGKRAGRVDACGQGDIIANNMPAKLPVYEERTTTLRRERPNIPFRSSRNKIARYY